MIVKTKHPNHPLNKFIYLRGAYFLPFMKIREIRKNDNSKLISDEARAITIFQNYLH